MCGVRIVVGWGSYAVGVPWGVGVAVGRDTYAIGVPWGVRVSVGWDACAEGVAVGWGSLWGGGRSRVRYICSGGPVGGRGRCGVGLQ